MNRATITQDLAEILELPVRGHGKGKACEIANAVIRVMTDALQRGESIRIDGLGTFGVRTRCATRRTHYFYPLLGKGGHVETVDTPEKKIVFFRPSENILRTLNG